MLVVEGNLKNVWTYHAVASLILTHSFLLARPEVDAGKTAVTGISWGGYLTCIVAGLDNRFKAAVPVYGCGYYDESDAFGEPLSKLMPVKTLRACLEFKFGKKGYRCILLETKLLRSGSPGDASTI